MSLNLRLYSSEKVKKQCEHCGSSYDENELVYVTNISNNWALMAIKLGLYDVLWEQNKIKAEKASDIIEILEKGLFELRSNSEYFSKFAPENSRGFEYFVEFISDYLEACKLSPDATIYINT